MDSKVPSSGTGQGEQLDETDRMTETDSTPETSHALREVEQVVTPRLSMADIQDMTGCFTGAAIDINTACTAAEDETCQVFMQMAIWNELLFPARLQLREDSYAHSQLSLVSRSTPRFVDPPFEIMQKALTCACWLLKSHNCVVTIDLSLEGFGTWESMLCEALKENSSVKYAKICHYTSRSCQSFLTVLLSLEHLVELEFGYGEITSQLQTALSTLLRSTVSLRALRIHLLEVKGDASVLLEGLFANDTLKELSLNESVLSKVTEEYRDDFAKFMENNVILTTLNLFGNNTWLSRESPLSGIFYGLLGNKTMRNLSITDFVLDSESSRLLTNFLEATDCLRCFKMISAGREANLLARYRQHQHINWIFALAWSKTIEEVTLFVRLCNALTWKLFFKALSSNGSTMKVFIEDDYGSVYVIDEVGEALHENCMEDRVSVSNQVHVIESPVLTSKALSRVSVYTSGASDIKLSWCSHITSVRLIMTWSVNEPLFTAIAEYVETTITLKELCLERLRPAPSRQENFTCWTIFTRSLSRNNSIRKVGIDVFCVDKEIVELLADVVKSRKDTWRLEFSAGTSAPQSAFIRRLSVGIPDNFSLLSVTVPGWIEVEAVKDWFLLDDTVRRNTGLLRRATQFVTGVLRDSCGAHALERVSGHAALLEEVMQVASVESGEADAMIRQALRSIEGMDVFMRLSGVVKERVVCLPSQDGRPQLDALDEYCWRRVRRYLLLRDVRYFGHP